MSYYSHLRSVNPFSILIYSWFIFCIDYNKTIPTLSQILQASLSGCDLYQPRKTHLEHHKAHYPGSDSIYPRQCGDRQRGEVCRLSLGNQNNIIKYAC